MTRDARQLDRLPPSMARARCGRSVLERIGSSRKRCCWDLTACSSPQQIRFSYAETLSDRLWIAALRY